MQFAKLKNYIDSASLASTTARKTGAIGIDFGIEKINLVQVTRTNGQFKINEAASVSYPETREDLLKNPLIFRKIIKNTLQEKNFKKTNVVASLPPTMMKLSLLNYHCENNKKTELAISKAISEQLKDNLATSVIDYLPIRPKVEEQVDRSALIAMANQTETTEYLESLRIAGLNVKALEIGPIAIKRLLTSLEDQNNSINKILAINFGTENSFVTVLWGGELLLDRELNIGLNSIIENISDSLDISESEAKKLMQLHGFSRMDYSAIKDNDFFNEDITSSLTRILKPTFIKFAREIKKVLIYTSAETQGGAIDVVYILGSVARWPKVDEYLANLINLPVKTINPFFGFSIDDLSVDLDELEPISGIAVATGLALHGL